MKIPDSTMLNLASQIIRKGEVKKYKVGDEVVSTRDVYKYLKELSERAKGFKVSPIKPCITCGNFNASARKGRNGWCSPKDFTSSRAPTEYCSRWIPMSKDQADLRRKFNEHITI